MEKYYMVGNTHFDPVWLWRWDEGMSAIAAAFRSVLARMDEYPDFIYSFCCPPVFEWIKKTDPALFERIKERVAEGRWELSEGMWVQPDCFSPSGESLVRQALYAQRYIKENFGVYARSAFNTDSFGHPAALPQILKKCGMDSYVFGRPEAKHLPLESELFRWVAPDGSAVSAYRNDQHSYIRSIEESVAAVGEGMIVYGVTDHGGAPAKKAIEDIMRTDGAVFSTVGGFFDTHAPECEFSGELITGDYGPYVNGTRIKSANRRAEYAILNAEKSCVIAGAPEREKLTACWKDVLFCQFHDILGGASIKDAYRDALDTYGRAAATALEIMHFNLLRVTNDIALPGKDGETFWNVVVWNLNCAPFDGYIEAEVQWVHERPWYEGGIALEDADGVRYRCQVIREKSVIPGFRSRFLFKARVPAMGYKAFRVIQTGEETNKKPPEFTGGVDGFEIRDGRLFTPAGGALLAPVCFEDGADTWAFKTKCHGRELEPPALKSVKYVEYGELRSVVKARFAFRDSLIDAYYTFYAGEPYIDVRCRVNWNEKHVILKLMTGVTSAEHTAATPYAGVSRGESAAELPVGEWLETKDLTFALNGIFSYNLRDGRLGLNVLRSPLYGELRIAEPDPEADHDVMAQGVTEAAVRVFFEKPARVQDAGSLFNDPPVVLYESNHGGSLAGEGSFMSCDASVTAVKYAEDDDGVIVRGAEYEGKAARVRLILRSKEYAVDVAPHEIFTVKIKDGEIRKVNMTEDR